jgi:hyperosmotically inducible protein
MKKQVTLRLSSLIIASALFAGGSAMANPVDEISHTTSSAVKSTENFVSDTALTTKVKAALLTEKGLQSTYIKVSTKHSKVTLSGYVPNQKQAWRAGEVAAGIKGVAGVGNALIIRHGNGQSADEYLSDAAITSKIKAEYLITQDLPATTISVKTEEGHVVLSGSVESTAQAKRAVKIAKQVKDVKGVKNELQLK